ncbi:MAG: glycyl-radical enzyme activating protein [Desulfomonilia bacterium]
MSHTGTGRNSAVGLIFNVQHFSIHDGPGIRTTIFMKGCPLHCPWCSNPESINPHVQIRTAPEKCKACFSCIEACSRGALSMDQGRVIFDHDLCDDCLECASACTAGGITTIGTRMGMEQALERLLKDEPFYVNTGGGVTVSGGEPLLQHEFISMLFSGLKDRGVHTALDTSGFSPWDVMRRVLEHVDLVLFDVKHLDPVKHRCVIGVDNELILGNLRKASDLCEIWVRTPLIPGFNDDFKHADAIVDLAREIGATRCCFLPFHRWGEHKYSRLGLMNSCETFREFLPEEGSRWRERYQSQQGFVSFEKA